MRERAEEKEILSRRRRVNDRDAAFRSEGGSRRKLQTHDCQPELRLSLCDQSAE